MKKYIYLAFFFIIAIGSCNREPDMTVPADIIQPEQMVDILVDVNKADAMQNISKIRSNYKPQELYKAVYKKHKVSRKEFDRSMQYYAAHNRKLAVIYQRVESKLTKAKSKLKENSLKERPQNE